MAAMTLSSAKATIRAAREVVRHQGKFKGQEPWVAALYDSNWMGCENDFAGGDGLAWCGLWEINWADTDVCDGDWYRLFRDVQGATCVTLVESDDGFVTGAAHFNPVAEVAASMHRTFDPGCPYCGAVLNDGGLELEDGELVCSSCASECERCGCIALVDDGFMVDEDGEGDGGFVCQGCLHGN